MPGVTVTEELLWEKRNSLELSPTAVLLVTRPTAKGGRDQPQGPRVPVSTSQSPARPGRSRWPRIPENQQLWGLSVGGQSTGSGLMVLL